MRVNREDLHEAQPLLDGATMLVADLRLDNREALAEQLAIPCAALPTMPDSALLLGAYRRWGEDCVDHLLGDFAFAIRDAYTGRVLLARDPVGMRGLHLYRGDGFLAFATEAKALHALKEVPRALDPGAMLRLLTGNHHARDPSPFAGIAALEGGTAISIDTKGREHRRIWWEPEPAREHIGQGIDYYIETYRVLLTEAVACRTRRLIAQPGLLLSGGFDSGAIAGLHPGRIVAVTSCLPEGAAGPHLRHDARPGATWCRDHMPHLDHRWFVRGAESCADDGDQLRHTIDGVPGGGNYVFEAMYTEIARAGARAVLDGVGGDCTINPRVPRLLVQLLRARQFRRFWSELRAECRISGRSFWRVLRAEVLPPLFPRLRRLILDRGRGAAQYWPDPYAEPALRRRLHRAGQLGKTWHAPRHDLRGDLDWRIDMLRVLQARARQNGVNEAAAHRLEVLRPMLDRRLIEFGLAIPPWFQMVEARNRYIARRALADILPPEFQTRAHGQEHLDPAMRDMVIASLPRMRSDLAAMRGRPDVEALLDLERILADAAPARAETLSRAESVQLSRAYCMARYLAWFADETNATRLAPPPAERPEGNRSRTTPGPPWAPQQAAGSLT
jgi:asparagine synthase (glutamine-hydrolysing)